MLWQKTTHLRAFVCLLKNLAVVGNFSPTVSINLWTAVVGAKTLCLQTLWFSRYARLAGSTQYAGCKIALWIDRVKGSTVRVERKIAIKTARLWGIVKTTLTFWAYPQSHLPDKGREWLRLRKSPALIKLYIIARFLNLSFWPFCERYYLANGIEQLLLDK